MLKANYRRKGQVLYLLEPGILTRSRSIRMHIFFSTHAHEVDASIIKAVDGSEKIVGLEISMKSIRM